MSGVSGTWRGRPPEVWALTVMVLMGAALCLTVALRPALPESPVALNAICAALGPILAALLWWPRTARWRGVRVHTVVVVKLLLSFLLVAASATGEGAMASAMGIVWIGLYVSAFHPPPIARTYLAVAVVGLGIAMHANAVVRNAWGAWLVVIISTVAAGEVYSRLLRRAEALSVTDQLTGLSNRQGLYQRIEIELSSAARHGRPLALAAIDLDGLKVVNDRDGHQAGDLLLQTIATELSDGIRAVDALFRVGGDEFLLLLPDTGMAQACLVLDRLHAASTIEWSYGIAVAELGEVPDAIMARADRQMYAHKGDRQPASPCTRDATSTLWSSRGRQRVR